jgi:hypothetical protein
MNRITTFLCACCAAASSSVVIAGDPAPIPLRIATLNTKEGLNLNAAQYFATGDFMTTNDTDGIGPNSGLNPDIVLLQECRNSGHLIAFRDAYLPGYQFFRVNAVDPGGNFNACFIRGDIIVRDTDDQGVSGPRPVHRVSLSVPGALRVITLYNAHFKAFGDSGSQSTRTTEANNLGNQVYNDLLTGVDLDDNGSRETITDVAVFGDLNSNNNADGTLTGLFTHYLTLNPTGVLNLPVQNLSHTSIATFPGSSGRLDYGCLDANIAAHFDANTNGSYSQTEINSMGFVYYSPDDSGQRSNGDSTATNFASDHRPVIFTIFLDADPAAGFDPKDLNLDTLINAEDLVMWEEEFFGGTGPAKDTDQDFDIDLDDRDLLYDCNRQDEFTDITT